MPGQNHSQVRDALESTARRKFPVGSRTFQTKANSMGQRSRIGRIRADTPLRILEGRSHPLRVAIPAYESFTTDGAADDQESFTLSHDVTETPNTAPVDVWLDGTHYGAPDSVDYDTGDITVTDPEANSTVHVFYVSGKAATLEVEKADGGAKSKQQTLYRANTALVHATDQSEQPEHFGFSTLWDSFIATDMTLDVYLDAPYVARFEDPDGDGARATNALLDFTTMKGTDSVAGLKQAVRAEM